MGLSGTAQGWEWPKRSPIPKICHTYPAKIKVGCYTLPKEDQKIHVSRVLVTSAFFIGNQQILLYQKMQI